ncbi:MAG: glycosyltransferase family 39 protein [Nitrospirae bacterium]|nr:glycosyltransferase family 39 protein [Nitrospirota bacterium]
MDSHVFKRTEFFLIALLTFFSFLIPFTLRAIDDNRLTSWLWAFSSVNITWFSLIIISGIILAYILTRVSFPKLNPSVFLFLLSFISVMPFWKLPEVIVDASRYFTQAKHLEVYGIEYFLREWGRDINIWTDMPIIPFLYGLIFKFFGESRVYIQAFTTLLFSMTVVLTYKIGKTLWNETVGIYAGVLLLGIPYLFSQIPLMLVDVPAMFFLTLSIFAFIMALERGGAWIPFSSAALFMAFFSKYSTWLMLSVLFVIFIVYSIQHSSELEGNYIYRASIIASITGLLIGIFFLYKFEVFSEQIRLLIAYQKPGLKRWEESFISTFFFQMHPFIAASAIYSAYAAFKRRDIKYAIISYLIILIILLQIKRIRYIIMVFPMLTLMASYGLQEIRDKDVRRFIASCIVICSLAIGMFAYLPFLQKTSAMNLKYAGEFLDSIDRENIEVFTIPQRENLVNHAVSVPIIDLFTKKKIIYYYDTGFLPPPEDLERSPLRFTWEYRNPEYYTAKNKDSKRALLVITDDLEQRLPAHIEQKIEGYGKSKVFKTWEGVFSYKTSVAVYYN